jgi:hypothetical protein
MRKTWYICFKDRKLKKLLFLGPTDTSWYSDYQSARKFTKKEYVRILPSLKRLNKGRRLKAIKILTVEAEK